MVRHGDNIALVGFMGAGKTTVAQALADHLRYTHVDTDELVAGRAGRSIPDLFAAEGEPAFRAREREALEHLGEFRQLVIACGGGLVTEPASAAALQQRAEVVWLRISAAEATRRILADSTPRPMIDAHVARRTPEAVLARVEELLATRLPFYQAVANRIVDVDGRTPEQIVRRIARGESDADG